jgi:hypothetical protein
MVTEYNTTEHSSIKMTPREARLPSSADALWALIPKPEVGKPKYKLNQWVRMSRAKGLFEKGFHPNWSYEIYKIVEIRMNEPVRYYLQDYDGEPVLGAFYEEELQPVADATFFPIEKVIKTRTVKGRKEALVKFMGYKEPRWRPASEVGELD